MNRSQARRGPDAEGIESWPTCVLGHRRLSIFDLSDAGKQPMLTEDGQVAVVFNGAIYNFRELRKELESRGCRFRSHTDTEVLLHGYLQWGMERMLVRLHGMFTIGLWDNRTQRLFLVRDRLGVKPLLYSHQADGSLAFASTARALAAAGAAGDLDPIGVAEFLEFGYVTDARSIYSGVKKIQAGQMLTWEAGRIQESSYWELPEASNRQRVRFADSVAETESLFLKAVEMRLFADVPVGALLSGGVDSSLICWAIAKLGGNLTAYTVATPGDPGDESEDAILTARSLGISHRVLPMSAEEGPDVTELVAAYGEPFACSSALGMLQLSRAIKPEATVLITGDGGDDVFLGYPEHNHLFMAQRLARWLPKPIARSWYELRKLALEVPALRRPAHFLDYATGGLGAVAGAHDGWPFYQQHGLLGDRLRGLRLSQREMQWSPDSGRRILRAFLDYDRRGRFTGEYMTKVDGSTMHYALEARAPFLDQEIWAYAAGLPYSVRLNGGELKAILRELARRHLGDRVARGRKRGFTIPAQRWLVGKWSSHAREVFSQSRMAEDGWVERTRLLSALDTAHANGKAPLQLWYLYVLENWLRHTAVPGQDLRLPEPVPAYSS